MFDNKKNNFDCNFNAEIVAYLYNEFADSEIAEFEKHLGKCSVCTDEIAAYTSVRTSIQDWKQAEFSNLTIPSFKIDFEQIHTPLQTAEVIKPKTIWLDNFKEFFSPLLVKTAAGFAAIAVVFGLGWFLFGSMQGDSQQIADIAVEKIVKPNEKQLKEQISVPEKPEVAAEESENVFPSKDKVEKDELAADNSDKSTRKNQNTFVSEAVSNKTASRNIKPKRNSMAAVNKQKTNKIKDKKKNLIKPEQKTPVINEQKPSLTEFAIEDTSDNDIRLSDIFDELDTDE